MTISQNPSAPLIVVVGATGAQGGSVVKNLAESDKPYRIRALTRDTSKPESVKLAKQGVELVTVDPTVENKEQVFKAFAGATYAFTMSRPSLQKGQEAAEGKMLVDAAKAASVKLLVWSGLMGPTELSGGKYTNCHAFDEKAEITKYAKETGIPFVNVMAGGYMQNYTGRTRPVKQADGSFILSNPVSPDLKLLPVIDTDGDYGLFVRKAIEEPMPSGTEIYAHVELMSHKDLVAILSKITGKNVVYVQVPSDKFQESMIAAGAPPSFALVLCEAWMSSAEFGYWGKADLAPSLQGLARKPRTWEEFVRATDWSEVLA